MEDRGKSQDELIAELALLRKRVTELESPGAKLLQMQEDLQPGEDALRSISAASPVGIVYTRGGRIQWANRAWKEMFRVGPDRDYLHQPTGTMYSSVAEYQQARSRLYKNVNEGGMSETVTVLKRSDGSVFNAHIRISVLDRRDPAKGTISAISDISRGSTAEQKLILERRRFEVLADNSPFAMLIVEPDGKLTYANRKFSEVFGYDLTEVPTGRDWFRKAFPDTRYRHEAIALWLEDLAQAHAGETTHRAFTVNCKDGNKKTILFRSVRTDSGEGFVTCEDITERTEMEKILRESERKYRTLVDNAPIGILVSDTRGKILDVNRACLEVLGSPAAEATKSINMLTFPPLMEAGISEAVSKCMVEAVPIRQDTPYISKWGKRSYLRMIIAPMLGEEGTVEGCQAVIEDISDRKTAEEALRDSESRFQAFMENSPIIAFIKDDQGRFLYGNQNWQRIHDLVGKDWHAKTSDVIFSPEDAAQFEETDKLILEQSGLLEYIRLHRDIDGSVRHFWMLKFSFQDADGRRYIGGTGIDISARVRAEEALKQSEEKLSMAIEAANLGLFDWNLTTGKTVWAERNHKMLGYEPSDWVPTFQTWEKLVHPEDWPDVAENLDLHLNGKIPMFDVEFRMKNKSGNWQWLHAFGQTKEVDSEPRSRRIIGVVSDITERKNLEAQLLQSQKMQAIGTLAAGIAHDFNNMLQVILGYADLLLLEKKREEPGYQELQKIIKTAQDARDLVQQIRIFSRKADIQKAPLDLNHNIEQVVQLLKHTLPKTVRIDVHPDEELAVVNADSGLMNQMLTNLAINAAEAMPDGGALNIRSETILLEDAFCKRHLGVTPGLHVLLTVSDTGRGIEKDRLERLFDPFYSTKMRDYHKGTGLGLPVVLGIVEMHRGVIDVESGVGKGTTFRIYLPAMELAGETRQVQEIGLPSKGSETVLLVEDEDLVRNLGTYALEQFGYNVIAVCDGQEALEVYEREKENISLVILDIIMPRMDGKQCFKELLRMNPHIKVIISSGVVRDELIQEVVNLGAKGSLVKPFDVRDLLQKVREVLDAH